ncbi:hypothetical protein GCM10027048_25070 [Hymenobacter coalescens]
MPRLFSIAALLSLLSSGCGSSLSFEPYAVRRPVNLEQVLGRRIVLVSARDTQALTIRFEPATRKNLITRTGQGDTLLYAWATKYRRLYYLTEEQRNGTYLVHAASLKREQVQGLTDQFSQQMLLHTAVNRGDYAALVTYQAKDSSEVRLRYDAEMLRPFYAAAVPQYPVYRVVSADEFGGGAPAMAPARMAFPARVEVFPNPAHEQVTVACYDTVRRTVELLDLRGRPLLSRRSGGAVVTLSLRTVPPGVYMLRLRNERTHAVTARRLVVE